MSFTIEVSAFDYGDLFNLAAFEGMVKSGAFIDYDGFGNPVKDGLVDPDVEIKPSRLDLIPEGTTEILWFNR